MKKDGPIRVHEAHLLSQGGFADRGGEAEQRGAPEDKLAIIAKDAALTIEKKKAIRAGSDQDHLLKQTETNLKFGIFSLTLQYFRAMTVRRHMKHGLVESCYGIRRKSTTKRSDCGKEMMEKEQNMLKKPEESARCRCQGTIRSRRRSKRIQRKRQAKAKYASYGS